jgi:hypothetical protein
MAATALTIVTLTEQTPTTPITEPFADATNGNTVVNGPTLWLEFTNTVASVATVTVAYTQQVDGQTVPPRSYSLPATVGAKRRAGIFPIALFGPNLAISCSLATVSIVAYQLG